MSVITSIIGREVALDRLADNRLIQEVRRFEQANAAWDRAAAALMARDYAAHDAAMAEFRASSERVS